MPEAKFKKNYLYFRSASLLLWLLCAPLAHAKNCDLSKTIQTITPKAESKTIVLFDKLGRPGKAYNPLVDNLSAGDSIKFCDGSTYTIREILGSGETSKVLDVGGGKAIRIPLNNDERANEVFSEFPIEHKFLKEAGVPVVDMFEKENIPYQKIVVSREKFQFTLDDYLSGNTGQFFTQAQKKTLDDKLVEFARKTWQYEMIGDFGTHQMGLTEKGEWVLFDAATSGAMMHARPLFDLKSKANIFSPFKIPDFGISSKEMWHDIVPPKLYEKIEDAIAEERKFQRKKGSWLKRNDYYNENVINHMTPDPIPVGRTLNRPSLCIMTGRPVGEGCFETSPEVTFTIVKHIADDDALGIYEVKLPSGKSAVLKILKSDEKDALKQLRKTIKKSDADAVMESGNDFVLLRK